MYINRYIHTYIYIYIYLLYIYIYLLYIYEAGSILFFGSSSSSDEYSLSSLQIPRRISQLNDLTLQHFETDCYTIW